MGLITGSNYPHKAQLIFSKLTIFHVLDKFIVMFTTAIHPYTISLVTLSATYQEFVIDCVFQNDLIKDILQKCLIGHFKDNYRIKLSRLIDTSKSNFSGIFWAYWMLIICSNYPDKAQLRFPNLTIFPLLDKSVVMFTIAIEPFTNSIVNLNGIYQGICHICYGWYSKMAFQNGLA